MPTHSPAHAPPATPDWLGELDRWLLAEGRHQRPWLKLGAHPTALGGVDGTAFAVWAPHAQAVALLGDFNGWQAQPMRLHPQCGVWELFLPGVGAGGWYQFEVLGADGQRVLKTDPYARETELPPKFAARICPSITATPPPAPASQATPHAATTGNGATPMTIYEVHAGSWRRPWGPDTTATWDDLTHHLVPYVVDMGFTHIELMPVAEHPFYGSWGYQPTGLFAPTARHGGPDGFRRFVDAVHAAGLKLIIDWVPAHFPNDGHALARFDGTPLYEYADPREGFHRDWHTLIYNWARPEVRNFLVGNALFWIEHYGVDGLRVDAVASMLYRDYSRPDGEWLANQYGGRENLEAIAFLRELNDVLNTEAPHALTIAEESTAFPLVTGATAVGGLGFTHKWNMGWMHDTLAYFAQDPINRRWHHDRLTFGLTYAHTERFVLPLSHDEVVHGKGSLLAKMPGDRWQQFANLRALLAWMYGHPGKKLLFMGIELAQPTEWAHDGELPWHLLSDPAHAGMQRLVRDLNHLLRQYPAMSARDGEPGGFEWHVVDDAGQSVLAFSRHGVASADRVLVVANLTPVVRHGYRIGVHPGASHWREVLNTDSAHYGGSNVGNHGGAAVEAVAAHGHAQSVVLTLPPLAVVWLQAAK